MFQVKGKGDLEFGAVVRKLHVMLRGVYVALT
jgi:hypothetical protein